MYINFLIAKWPDSTLCLKHECKHTDQLPAHSKLIHIPLYVWRWTQIYVIHPLSADSWRATVPLHSWKWANTIHVQSKLSFSTPETNKRCLMQSINISLIRTSHKQVTTKPCRPHIGTTVKTNWETTHTLKTNCETTHTEDQLRPHTLKTSCETTHTEDQLRDHTLASLWRATLRPHTGISVKTNCETTRTEGQLRAHTMKTSSETTWRQYCDSTTWRATISLLAALIDRSTIVPITIFT